MGDPRHDLGLAAEQAVAAWLEQTGWRVLGRRVRSASGGEVDLVALDPARALVAIEVRARRTARTGTAAEAVDSRRMGRMSRTLAAVASSGGARHTSLRLDLVTVEPDPDAAGRWRLRRTPDIGSR